MRNEAGEIEATRKGIGDTIEKFYKDLYSRRTGERKMRRTTKEDLKTLVTMLTMIKILKTMNKTNTSQNLPT